MGRQTLDEVAKMLLARDNIEVNAMNSYGGVRLLYTAENGHEAVEMLLARDDVEIDSSNQHGGVTLSYAVQNGHETTVEMLLAWATSKSTRRTSLVGSIVRCPIWALLNHSGEAFWHRTILR